MNLLLISENPRKADVKDIEAQLQANGHQVYLPYDIYDDHLYTVPSFQIDGKTYISTHAIAKAVNKEKESYFQYLLSLRGKEKVDAAFFYNQDNHHPVNEENYLQILKVLQQDIPVYLYQDSFTISYMGSSVGKEALIHSINQDINRIKPINTSDKIMIKRRK